MAAADLETRVRGMHREGVAATGVGRPADGARLLRAGLALLGWNERAPGRRGARTAGAESAPGRHPALAARLLISLAYAEAELGRTRYGFDLLTRAEPLTGAADTGVLLQQRALMLFRTGRFAAALEQFAAAVPLLGRPEHAVLLCGTLLNRAALHQRTGRVDAARADLARCERLAHEHGLGILAAKALHSKGICDKLAGDLPLALVTFDAAEKLYLEHGPGFLPVLQAARADALLTAGLAGEAGRQLDGAIEAFRRQRLSQEQAEAELLRALAAFEAGDLDGAAEWARRAARRFTRRGNASWALLAGLRRLQAELPRTATPLALARRASAVAGRLRRAGLPRDAELAALVAVRATVAARRPGPAAQSPPAGPGDGTEPGSGTRPGGGAGPASAASAVLAGRLRSVPRSRGPASLELQLTRDLARAEVAAAAGRHGMAMAAVRTGLERLDERRNRLGSVDLRAGIAALGDALASAGLDYAFARGAPADLFAWSERARAQAFRVPPVRPPADPDVAAALAELRQLRADLRVAEIDRRPRPGARARCAELEQTIRERTWQVAGPGRSAPVVELPELVAGLDGRVLVNYVVRRGEVFALVVSAHTQRIAGLGPVAVVEEAQQRLIADLDALVTRQLPARLEAVISASVRRCLDTLGEALVAPLAADLGDAALVVLPTRALSSTPWSLLPGMRGRPTTVAASASSWLAAQQAPSRLAAQQAPPRLAAQQAPPHLAAPKVSSHAQAPPWLAVPKVPSHAQAPPLLVAGPGLDHAAAEIAEIAAVHPGCRTLTGAAATAAATLDGLDGAALAHLAAHGHHEPDNVLFSCLDLADGPLMAYDIQRLARPPAHVTLSACDVGRTVVRTGDEMLGFTAALLYAGTSTVVSCVARVAHDTAAAVMTRYHRELAAGSAPATALATASAPYPLAPFVCFGAG